MQCPVVYGFEHQHDVSRYYLLADNYLLKDVKMVVVAYLKGKAFM